MFQNRNARQANFQRRPQLLGRHRIKGEGDSRRRAGAQLLAKPAVGAVDAVILVLPSALRAYALLDHLAVAAFAGLGADGRAPIAVRRADVRFPAPNALSALAVAVVRGHGFCFSRMIPSTFSAILRVPANLTSQPRRPSASMARTVMQSFASARSLDVFASVTGAPSVPANARPSPSVPAPESPAVPRQARRRGSPRASPFVASGKPRTR